MLTPSTYNNQCYSRFSRTIIIENNLLLQIEDLIKTENIYTAEDYKNYMEDYVILCKKVFDKMTSEQKSKSIILQEKLIEEMNKQKREMIANLKDSEQVNLSDTQIQMSINILQYCKEHF